MQTMHSKDINKMKTKRLFSIIAIFLTCNYSYAQPGSLDLTFNPNTDSSGLIEATAIQSDGKILIGGRFSFNFNMNSYRIHRLNLDGSIDFTFNPQPGFGSSIYSISIQKDEKIIIGGNFANYNGTGINCIARLNKDGSPDLSFVKGVGADYHVYSISIQTDGKIIIGGDFFRYNGTYGRYIARINSNGTLDSSFNKGSGPSDYIRTTLIQSDGKIIIGGIFNTYNGIACRRIARLNPDGSLDQFFNIGTGFNNSGTIAQVYSTSIQSDGKIIVGGVFDSYNGVKVKNIVRLNPNGIIDPSFKLDTRTNSSIRSTAIQSDGKIIIAGFFTLVNGQPRNYIARLNIDGSLDTTFNPGTGANFSIRTTSLQSDGKVIIGGNFSSFDGVERNYIARIHVFDFANSVPPLKENETKFNLYPNPFSTHTTLQSDHNIQDGTLTIYNSLGEVVSQINNINGNSITIERGNLANGLYFIRLTEGSHEIMMKKVIVVD